MSGASVGLATIWIGVWWSQSTVLMMPPSLSRYCIEGEDWGRDEKVVDLEMMKWEWIVCGRREPVAWLARGSHIHVACRSVCDRDQESWSMKIVLDLLIAPFRGSWSLDATGVQRTKRTHACQVSEKVHWSVDISRSEFILIPWSLSILIPAASSSTGNVYVTTPWLVKFACKRACVSLGQTVDHLHQQAIRTHFHGHT